MSDRGSGSKSPPRIDGEKRKLLCGHDERQAALHAVRIRVGGETVCVNRLNPTGITLAACHRVLMNTEQGARAMRHVMVVVV